MADMNDKRLRKLITHQTKLLPLLEGPVLEIVTGLPGETVTWNIPKLLLIKHSEFFEAACKKCFKEGIENKIALDDILAELFRHFVEWLYCGRVRIGPDGDDWVFHQDCTVYRHLAMWVLGDRFLARNFKNHVMSAIWNEYHLRKNSVMDPDDVGYCWSNTTTTSKLRSFIMDMLSANWELHNETSDTERWTKMLNEHPELRDQLLYCLARKTQVHPKEYYMEAEEQSN